MVVRSHPVAPDKVTVAQLVERLLEAQGVVGSNPSGDTIGLQFGERAGW